VPKSGHVTIMKIENLHIDTSREFTYSKNAILFDLRRKITKLSRKYRFRTVPSRRLWRFQQATVLERSKEVGLSLIFSIYQVVYININDLHAGYAATRWSNLLPNFPKTKLHYAI